MRLTARPTPRLIHAMLSRPWLILPEKLEEIIEVVGQHHTGLDLSTTAAAVRRAQQPTPTRTGRVLVMPLMGTIFNRANLLTEFSGGVTLESFSREFAAAVADETIDAIVLDVDSPGGVVDGVPEMAAQIYAARDVKPVIAVANTLAASAAYWIASAASELVASPSAQVGSVGVITIHTETSERDQARGVRHTVISAGRLKSAGNPVEPLNDETRASLQRAVDEYYAMFVSDVARNRNVSESVVRAGFGEGSLVRPEPALAERMIDVVETLDQTLSRWTADPGDATAVAIAGSPSSYTLDVEL